MRVTPIPNETTHGCEDDLRFEDMPDEELVVGAEEDDGDVREPRVDWDVPEVGAAVILVAVGLLVLGGLATGIAAASGGTQPLGTGVEGSFIQLGALWAEPLLAIVLLGVLGLSWWRVDVWSGAPSETALAEVRGHIRRGQHIALWVNGALVLTLAGSMSTFAGLILTDSQTRNLSSLIWSRDIYQAAGVVAVAVILSGGMWVRHAFAERPGSKHPVFSINEQ